MQHLGMFSTCMQMDGWKCIQMKEKNIDILEVKEL